LGEEEKILERIKENSQGIRINRVPPKTKVAFIKLAEEEFCGDYGMTLKFLVDDIMSQDTRFLMESLRNHEERLLLLEQKQSVVVPVVDKIEDNEKKMLDGSIRKVKT
jgi:hypothetical protein